MLNRSYILPFSCFNGHNIYGRIFFENNDSIATNIRDLKWPQLNNDCIFTLSVL